MTPPAKAAIPESALATPPSTRTWPATVAGVARSAWTVFRFENRRSRTWLRMMLWAIVVLFPGFILLMMRIVGGNPPHAVWVSLLFVFVTEMVVLLNGLLWVAPLIQAELEGKTWIYVATRPFGRLALVLGKGLTGLLWTVCAGLSSLFIALVLSTLAGAEIAPGSNGFNGMNGANPTFTVVGRDPTDPQSADVEDWPERVKAVLLGAFRSGATLALLTVLSSLVYSPLFAAIGCIAPRRAMLIVFSYTLVFEVLISFVPAVVSRITVQYHLRCLLTKWIDLGMGTEAGFLSSESSPAWHVACLLTMSFVWTAAALSVVHYRTYVTNDEA